MAKKKGKQADVVEQASSTESKGKQQRIPGTERPDRNEAIEKAAAVYADARDRRMALTKEETAAKAVLAAAMKDAKLQSYSCDTDDLDVECETDTKENVKVKRRKGAVEDSDGDDDE